MSTSIADSPITLRPAGIARYFSGGFLIVWLVGWVLGEVFALGVLIMLIRSVIGSVVGMPRPVPGGEWIAGGAAGFVFLFILFWLAIWTAGGYGAIHELLRSMAGEDRISADATGVELVRRAGPFSRVRMFDRALIRRVRLRIHDKAVVLDTSSGTEVMTKFGTSDERQDMVKWLRSQLSLPADGRRVDPSDAPPGWQMTVDGGVMRLNRMDPRTRWTGAAISWVIVGLTGLIWVGSAKTTPESSNALALALTLLLAVWASWVTWSSREWLVQPGQLTSHRRFAVWTWERAFTSARLEVVLSTDSDNDHHYKLKIIDGDGKRTIASEMNDDADVVDLGRWLAARTGFPLT